MPLPGAGVADPDKPPGLRILPRRRSVFFEPISHTDLFIVSRKRTLPKEKQGRADACVSLPDNPAADPRTAEFGGHALAWFLASLHRAG